ncbi:MAG: hypothetical protein ACYDAY_11990 [Candidatus Dormibacteria bacterium]
MSWSFRYSEKADGIRMKGIVFHLGAWERAEPDLWYGVAGPRIEIPGVCSVALTSASVMVARSLK